MYQYVNFSRDIWMTHSLVRKYLNHIWSLKSFRYFPSIKIIYEASSIFRQLFQKTSLVIQDHIFKRKTLFSPHFLTKQQKYHLRLFSGKHTASKIVEMFRKQHKSFHLNFHQASLRANRFCHNAFIKTK